MFFSFSLGFSKFMLLECVKGFPLALVAENTPKLELLVGGNLECITLCKRDSFLEIKITDEDFDQSRNV